MEFSTFKRRLAEDDLPDDAYSYDVEQDYWEWEEPDQVVSGRGDALVAQSRRGPGLLRVPYVEEGEERILLTLYWTSKTDKYWRMDS